MLKSLILMDVDVIVMLMPHGMDGCPAYVGTVHRYMYDVTSPHGHDTWYTRRRLHLHLSSLTHGTTCSAVYTNEHLEDNYDHQSVRNELHGSVQSGGLR